MIFYYTSSLSASAVSITASALLMVSIYLLINEEIPVAVFILLAAIAVVLLIGASHVNKASVAKKQYKKWLKTMTEKNLFDEIKTSTYSAVKLYSSCPNKYTQECIAKLNPYAGTIIASDNYLAYLNSPDSFNPGVQRPMPPQQNTYANPYGNPNGYGTPAQQYPNQMPAQGYAANQTPYPNPNYQQGYAPNGTPYANPNQNPYAAPNGNGYGQQYNGQYYNPQR